MTVKNNLILTILVSASMASLPVSALTCDDQKDVFERALCFKSAGRHKEAFVLLESQAKGGSSGAQLVLADMYLSGEGTSKSVRKGRFWAERAFLAGARGAVVKLAATYSTKEATFPQFIAWLAVDAGHGKPYAAAHMGDFFSHKNVKYAAACLSAHWYSQALLINDDEKTIDKLNAEAIAVVTQNLVREKKKCELIPLSARI